MNEQQRKAMELALETLETHVPYVYKDRGYAPITAIKEALAQDALQALHDENKSLGLYEPEQEPWLLETTQTLAKHMAREFYPEVTQWECLDNLAGVISQIDNMTTGLMRKPEQEPVAYFNPQVKGGFYWAKPTKITAPVTVSVEPMPLYTTPPQRKPLTDEQISDMWCEVSNTDFVTGDTHVFARAIEAAHGIKE